MIYSIICPQDRLNILLLGAYKGQRFEQLDEIKHYDGMFNWDKPRDRSSSKFFAPGRYHMAVYTAQGFKRRPVSCFLVVWAT